MSPEIKFCGLTRAEDAAAAVSLGAAYVGVIFAGGPRMLNTARAAAVLSGVPSSVTRVGVFADQSASDILAMARTLSLGAVQLHGAFDDPRTDAIRRDFDGELWAVVRIAGADVPADIESLAARADGLLLDAYVAGSLGGTGVALPWAALADRLAPLRSHVRLVLAGGLRPENVGSAIATLSPDVVDVSSGVESAPGIKDHARMRAFRDAVANSPVPI